jgi:aspartyl-tRNA(Asn)/glutamyl-tRNA(Gln) amidotransferase subunit C
MSIDEKMTRKVAELARLDLSDQEVTTFTSQLGQILGYVDQLQELSVEGVEPLVHPIELETPLREDQVVPSRVDADGNPLILKSAPDVLYGGYKVPSIL